MAINDAYPFIDSLLYFGAVHNFVTGDTVKCALIKPSFGPLTNTPHPCWGPGGTTDLSAHEVAVGGVYSAGGKTCANSSTSLSGSEKLISFNSPSNWAQHASNPENARWAIFYNDSAPNKECLGFYDLGAEHDMSGGETIITVPNPFCRFSVV